MDELTEQIRAMRDDLKDIKAQQNMPQLMTPEQCAEYLNRSVEVLYLWRKERNTGRASGPPFLHISSKTILYDRQDVLEWARSHRVN